MMSFYLRDRLKKFFGTNINRFFSLNKKISCILKLFIKI